MRDPDSFLTNGEKVYWPAVLGVDPKGRERRCVVLITDGSNILVTHGKYLGMTPYGPNITAERQTSVGITNAHEAVEGIAGDLQAGDAAKRLERSK